MCLLIGTPLVNLWCYDHLCLTVKCNVRPDIYIVICRCSVNVDVAASEIKYYSDVSFSKVYFPLMSFVCIQVMLMTAT